MKTRKIKMMIISIVLLLSLMSTSLTAYAYSPQDVIAADYQTIYTIDLTEVDEVIIQIPLSNSLRAVLLTLLKF